MRPLHLANLDPQRAADALTREVHARAQRDARSLGFVLTLPAGIDPKTTTTALVLAQSKLHKLARTCVEWATSGKGKPDEVANALRELRAALDGVEPGEFSGREQDPTTVAGLTVLAAEARLALGTHPPERTLTAATSDRDPRRARRVAPGERERRWSIRRRQTGSRS